MNQLISKSVYMLILFKYKLIYVWSNKPETWCRRQPQIKLDQYGRNVI